MSHAIVRRIRIEPGAWVTIQGRRACIVQVLDLETVVVQDTEREETWAAKICDLQPDEPPPEPPTETPFSELAEIEEPDWQTARERFEIIRPLLNDPDCTREKVEARAQAAGRHATTLYRWLQDYRQSGQLSTLAPAKSGVPRGYSRLDPEVETLLVATIDEFYLHGQKRSMQQTCHEVARRCRNAGIKRPHPNTVRHRIKALSDQETFRRREGGKGVRDKYTPIPGAFPGAHWPLAVIQIDHTPVDLILVDDVHRRPVGRPWVTVAIDVFSRLVAGFSVSFDPPGSLAVGLCLAHAILPKDLWLARHEIATSWPIWGVMDTVHADNAKEFRGSMLRKACQEYGMEIQFLRTTTRCPALESRTRGQVVFDNLAAGCAPHALVAQDIGECRVECADAVRHADDEWMQANRHDATGVCALAIESVELAADHAFELIRRAPST
jgi:putative transposase